MALTPTHPRWLGYPVHAPWYDNLVSTIFENTSGYREGDTIFLDGDSMMDVAMSIYQESQDGVGFLTESTGDDGKPMTNTLIQNRALNHRDSRVRKMRVENDLAETTRDSAVPRFVKKLADSDLSPEEYSARQVQRMEEGMVDAWRALAPGPLKEALAKRLGIAGVTSRNNELFSEGVVRNAERTAETRAEFVAGIRRFFMEEYNLDLNHLFNGDIDAADGYTIGRAAIEAVAPEPLALTRVRTTLQVPERLVVVGSVPRVPRPS